MKYTNLGPMDLSAKTNKQTNKPTPPQKKRKSIKGKKVFPYNGDHGFYGEEVVVVCFKTYNSH